MQGSYGSKDFLCKLKFSTALLNPKFGVASHFVSSHDDKINSGNQTKHQHIQEAFVSNIALINEVQSGAPNVTSWTFSWCQQSMIRIFHTQLWCGMTTNTICFCIGTHSSLVTYAYGSTVSIRDVAKMIKWTAFGHNFLLQICHCLASWDNWLKVQGSIYI